MLPGAKTALGGASGAKRPPSTLIIGAVSKGEIGVAIRLPPEKLDAGSVSGQPADKQVNRLTMAIVLLKAAGLLPSVTGAPPSHNVNAVNFPVPPPPAGPRTPPAVCAMPPGPLETSTML